MTIVNSGEDMFELIVDRGDRESRLFWGVISCLRDAYYYRSLILGSPTQKEKFGVLQVVISRFQT